jgi:hypothetical protein
LYQIVGETTVTTLSTVPDTQTPDKTLFTGSGLLYKKRNLDYYFCWSFLYCNYDFKTKTIVIFPSPTNGRQTNAKIQIYYQ